MGDDKIEELMNIGNGLISNSGTVSTLSVADYADSGWKDYINTNISTSTWDISLATSDLYTTKPRLDLNKIKDTTDWPTTIYPVVRAPKDLLGWIYLSKYEFEYDNIEEVEFICSNDAWLTEFSIYCTKNIILVSPKIDSCYLDEDGKASIITELEKLIDFLQKKDFTYLGETFKFNNNPSQLEVNLGDLYTRDLYTTYKTYTTTNTTCCP